MGEDASMYMQVSGTQDVGAAIRHKAAAEGWNCCIVARASLRPGVLPDYAGIVSAQLFSYSAMDP